MTHAKKTQPIASTVAVKTARGMVATSESTAADIGLDILKKGGNAVDAAIATAAALTVVEPTSNGIGADAFALIWHQGRLHGLNGSGRSPEKLTIDGIRRRGHTTMPPYGLEPVTVPGAPAAWATLSKRFGRLSLETTLAPAIRLAKEGFVLQETVARHWQRAVTVYRKSLDETLGEPWMETFTVDGRAPRTQERFRLADHARTLERIARTDAADFYRGELAERIDAFSREHGGFIRKRDLQAHVSEWVEPIKTSYRGVDVFELPPNTQGLVALQALAIMERFPYGGWCDETTLHRAIEAIKIAFAEAEYALADPATMPCGSDAFLKRSTIDAYAASIGESAQLRTKTPRQRSGTVYLASADDEGTMVSFIQSNYMGFGSGIVVPGTGIALQNRGHNFSLDPSHPNALAPRKRPYHTIIPGFLLKDGEALGPFGVMGGFMQPQGHLQVVSALIDGGMDPQEALDLPRWRWVKDQEVEFEEAFPRDVVSALRDRGHVVGIAENRTPFGRGQIILKTPGIIEYRGGSDRRSDGKAAAW